METLQIETLNNQFVHQTPKRTFFSNETKKRPRILFFVYIKVAVVMNKIFLFLPNSKNRLVRALNRFLTTFLLIQCQERLMYSSHYWKDEICLLLCRPEEPVCPTCFLWDLNQTTEHTSVVHKFDSLQTSLVQPDNSAMLLSIAVLASCRIKLSLTSSSAKDRIIYFTAIQETLESFFLK